MTRSLPRVARCGLGALAVALSWGCEPQPPAHAAHPAPPASAAARPDLGPCTAGFGDGASLAVDKAALRAKGASPRLLAKLDGSSYRYFRLIGPEFAARICSGFKDVRWRLPVVAVHGDAHLEQFVVTRDTYGLEDFDQAGYGPDVLDLVRYAASLHIACREVSWPCRADDAVGSYFRAYRAAVDRPPERKAPSVVERLRGKAPQETQAWLRWADSLMRPLPPAEEAANRHAWAQFSRLLTDIKRDRPAAFYDVVRVGTLEMGIGSGLEKKVLFRIRGSTDAPTDDLILEARSTAPWTGNECAWRPAHGGSLHALLFMSLLGSRMPEVYGFVPLDENPSSLEFWVQSWDPGYVELSISDLQSQAELEEIVEDAARQLAGHFWTRFPEPLRPHQRYAQLRAFDMVQDRARRMARELADEVVKEWEHFRKAP